MPRMQANDVLNRVFAILNRSFAMYLSDADPWTSEADIEAKASNALSNIVADQRESCRRIAEMLYERREEVEQGEYPMDFTDCHFLSLDFLLTKLIDEERGMIAHIERLVPLFGNDRAARELVEETLGSERAHLEALESLAIQPA